MIHSDVETRAILLRDRVEACPATRIIDEAKAWAYFLAMARLLVAREERRG